MKVASSGLQKLLAMVFLLPPASSPPSPPPPSLALRLLLALSAAGASPVEGSGAPHTRCGRHTAGTGLLRRAVSDCGAGEQSRQHCQGEARGRLQRGPTRQAGLVSLRVTRSPRATFLEGQGPRPHEPCRVSLSD